MSWRRKFADYQNELSQKSADKLMEEFKELYQQAADEMIPMFMGVYQEACSTTGIKNLAPGTLFHLDSYWALLNDSKQRAEVLGNIIISLMDNQFHTMYADVFEGITPGGIKLPCFINSNEIQQVIDGNWGVDKRNWRGRVWIKMTLLWDKLVGALMEAVIKKRDPKKLQATLLKEFEGSRKALNSTMMIDISRIQSKAAARRYQVSRAMSSSPSADIASYVMTYGDESEASELAAEDVAAANILSDAVEAYDSNGAKAAMFFSSRMAAFDSPAASDQYFMWLCEADDLVCDECAELDETILTGEEADAIYPIHPNCRCVLEPVMEDDDDGEDDQWGEDDINGGSGAGGGQGFMDELGGYLDFIGAL